VPESKENVFCSFIEHQRAMNVRNQGFT